jgi:hypothetical protein
LTNQTLIFAPPKKVDFSILFVILFYNHPSSSHPQDDSTLNEPMPRVGLISSGESIAGYGDQSVTTIDYDYTRAYGGGSVGGGQSVVSSASATLGGWTNTGTMAGGNTPTQ